MKQTLHIIPVILSLVSLASILLYSNLTLVLGILALFLSLTFAVYSIIQKHKGKPNAYKHIFQEIRIFIITLFAVIFIGGMAGAFVNIYVSQFYGAILGLVCGLVTAFIVGYWMRKGISKLRA